MTLNNLKIAAQAIRFIVHCCLVSDSRRDCRETRESTFQMLIEKSRRLTANILFPLFFLVSKVCEPLYVVGQP